MKAITSESSIWSEIEEKKSRLSNPGVAGLQPRGERPMSKIPTSVSFFFLIFTRMTCMTTFPWLKFSLDCTSVGVSRAACECVSCARQGEAEPKEECKLKGWRARLSQDVYQEGCHFMLIDSGVVGLVFYPQVRLSSGVKVWLQAYVWVLI